ncbi:hypothetical protein J3F84DRAFT_346757 [Trichoderma pleuroticola]
MAGRTNRPVWETPDMDRKPILLFRANQTRRSQDGTDAFLPSGAVEHRPNPGPSRPANGDSSMSGNGSNRPTSDGYNGRVVNYGPDNTLVDAFRGVYGYDYYDHPGPVLPSLEALARMDPRLLEFQAAARHRVNPPGPSRGPRLQSPFAPVYPQPTATAAPVYPQPTATAAPAEVVAGQGPTVSPPCTSGNATTGSRCCGCVDCSGSTAAKCHQCQLNQQHQLLTTLWEEERVHAEQARWRFHGILQEENRISMDHMRSFWTAERTQLKAEIDYLSEQVQRIGDENIVLRGRLEDQVQAGEPIIHQGSFRGNTPLVDGSPPSPIPAGSPLSPVAASPLSPVVSSHPSPYTACPWSPVDVDPLSPVFGNHPSPVVAGPLSPVAVEPLSPVIGSPPSPVAIGPPSPTIGSPLSPVFGNHPSPVARRQSGGAGSPGSARNIHQVYGLPGCYSNLFGLGYSASNPSPLGTSVSLLASAPPNRASATRISMSPQPGQDTIPISPTFSPFLPSSPCPDAGAASGSVSTPVRSPKRPLSAVDVHEPDPKLEGSSLRASTVRKTTFEEAPPDGSPPSKRRRSLSHDYCIVSNLQGEVVDANDPKRADYEELAEMQRRYPDNYHYPTESRRLRLQERLQELLQERRRDSATPTASSVLHEGCDSLETEDRSATATAREEVGESSGVAYTDPSNHLRRVDSSGVLSAASGDAPLKGPLMIKNIPAQDELFLAALNERLEPISQGQDALPRAVQTPVAVPAPLSAVHDGPLDGADARQTTAPDNTDISGTQSEMDEEHDGVHGNMDRPVFRWPTQNDDDQRRDAHAQPMQRASRSKWPANPGVAYDGTLIKQEPPEFPWFTYRDDKHLPANAEASPAVPIKREDSGDDSDGRNSEPEVAIKFRSTRNFGAPFGRR